MKKLMKKMKGKKVLSMLLALIMVLATCTPAFSPIIAKAASEYPVELGFNNLFIFEEWANNKNSTTVVFGGAKDVGTLTTDLSAGSFKLKKTTTDSSVFQVYNGHGMDKTNSVKNTDYYSIAVEPNTTYCFSYNLDSNNGGDSIVPYLFMFDSDILCKVIYEAPGANAGANSFMFTTPADVAHIQFRFTLNAGGIAETVISNISVTRCDLTLDKTNLFVFDSWADNGNSTQPASAYGFGDGTITPDKNSKSITVNTNKSDDTTGMLFSGFVLGNNAGYYNISVDSNSTYVLNYNLINSLNQSFIDFAPYIVRYDSAGNFIDYVTGCGASGYGPGSCVFKTTANTRYVQLVFTSNHGNQTWEFRINNIELLRATEVNENKITPIRNVYTYGTGATYGTLPTPAVPQNYVFAGWNTKADGSGMRITADTPVQPVSYTVYPKFEPAVDSLTVETAPTKTIYTVGEKIDTTGLVLKATIKGKGDTDGDGQDDSFDTTFRVSSGYYCTPEVLSSVGTHTITANYGGKTATFTVTVKANTPGTVIVNGVSKDITITNNEYALNYSTSAFNRYEVTYESDSYVSAVATFNDGKTEEFFLEPSENGNFSSYVDDFLENNTYDQIVKIKFTTLDKANGEFKLVSLNTTNVADPGDTVYFENSRYEMGVSLKAGGVVSELYDLGNSVYARTYTNGNKNITQIDYLNKLNENYGENYNEQSNRVNLINTLDQGRYLQQSYYGTGDKPYVQSEYNNAAWPYNPVQGGNVIGETSKIIDYKVTDEYVYIKARPLDWAKWSDEYAATDSRYDPEWGDSYITDTYVEAWYYFQGDTIKVTNRKVDYSGLPEASHSQEYPALYLVEPLNHFVYNKVSAQNAWKTDTSALYNNYQFIDYTDSNRANHWKAAHQDGKLINYEEPEYWGLTELYKNTLSMQDFEPWVTVNENWAAFTASEDQDSFGVGIYTDVTNKFYYGVQPTMYAQYAGDTEGSVGSVDPNTPEYRHAQTINPSPELPTSYIAPTDTAIFRSYDPTEYTYYLTTGTVEDIRGEFKEIYENKAEKEAGKPKIAVPETVYLNPANYKEGQFYANNVLNPNNYYQIETKTEYTDMYLGVYAKNSHTHISVDVQNVDDPGNDVDVCAAGDRNASYDGIVFKFTDDTDANEGTFIFPAGLDMDFDSTAAGLQPGEKATVKWIITTYAQDPTINPNCEKEVFTAYTVMYAPQRTVGAVAESRKIQESQNEISSWITGANGVDHSVWSPLGSLHGDKKGAGYFIKDPLTYPDELYTGGTGESETDYIVPAITGADVDNNVYNNNTYVMQTATNGNDGSRAKSYLGLLTVDGSRYANTNQIPNLKIGYDVLRKEGKNDNISIGALGTYNSLSAYSAYYTLGTSESFTSTSLSDKPDASWTQYPTKVTSDTATPYRESIIPEYKVSEIDGKYIHALNTASCTQAYASLVSESRYATAGTSVLCSVTDKDALRESVTDAYGVKDSSPEFLEKLKEAATILGDPSASQKDIDLTQKELDEALSQIVDTFYALKYDNLFSIYEFSQHSDNMKVTNNGTAAYKDKTLTVVNGAITGGEAYTSYGSSNNFYKVTLKPNTEYVFEYDVTSDVKSQAFMFFYNSDNANSEAPTNVSVQKNGGAWQSKNESNSWWGNYADAGTYHFVIKFTTGATTTQAGFRFGNTSNDPVTSTFSNIKLIDAARYYADVEYASVEEIYKEYSFYGALPILTRPGYNFDGWKDEGGKTVTSSNVATKHESIFSAWTINTYTITYNANGGNVNPASQTYTVNDTLVIPMPTRSGYTFQGWTVTSAEGNWELNGICSPGEVPARMYGNVTLTAQWVVSAVNVTFDNLIDLTAWNKSVEASKGTMTNITSTGFTLTCSGANGELTSSSPYFTVEPGKKYKVDMDITGDNWDVYIFFCDENGAWIDFNDGTNRFSSNGGNQTRIFTAPNKSEVVKAQIRVDSNDVDKDNPVTFNNIRVWEDTGITVSPVNKVVNGGGEYGTLPTPTRTGYIFEGWKNDQDQWVNADAIVNSSTTVNLHSIWTQKQYGIHFSTNGGTGDCSDISVQYEQEFNLYDGLTAPGATFLGWSTNQFATKADYLPGDTISVSQLKGVDADTKDITLHAVWELTNDSVIDDIVVIDFDLLTVSVNPYINDSGIFSYHVTETEFVKSYDFGFSADMTQTATGTYGNFGIDKGSYTVTYTPTEIMGGVDQVTLYTKLVYQDNTEKILSNTVVAAPASNIYYEEAVISRGTGTANVDWDAVSSDESADAEEGKGVYGYDDYYEGSSQFSNNTYYSVSVDSINKRSETASFTFTGTGFDLIAACGANTGVQLVNIKQNGKLIKGYIVDTYYDTAEENPIVGREELIYQTPIVNWTGDSFGTYTVEITSYYLASSAALQPKSSVKSFSNKAGIVMNSARPESDAGIEEILEDAGLSAKDVELVWFDDNSVLNGGTGAAPTRKSSRAFAVDSNNSLILNSYIDGIRVYNTLDKDSSKYSAEEKNAVYANVVNSLVTSEDTITAGVAYMYGNADDFTWATYQKKGPKGEIYLTGGSAITFKIAVNPAEKVMIALRAVNGATTHTVNDVQFSIDSATEMYYDITNCIGTDEISQQTEVLVTVRNTGDKILAVNHIKFSGGDGTSGNGGITPRSVTRFASANVNVIENRFLPITEEDVIKIQNNLANEKIQGEVIDGVVMPIIEDAGDVPNIPGDGGETDGDTLPTDDPFNVFSLLEWLIELIKRILSNVIGTEQLF